MQGRQEAKRAPGKYFLLVRHFEIGEQKTLTAIVFFCAMIKVNN
jgi:hypothetical protein